MIRLLGLLRIGRRNYLLKIKIEVARLLKAISAHPGKSKLLFANVRKKKLKIHLSIIV